MLNDLSEETENMDLQFPFLSEGVLLAEYNTL